MMELQDKKLRGHHAVVTGASSGIGLCFSKTLASEGCDLTMVSNERDALIESAQAIEKEFGVKARAFYCDLTSPGASESIIGFLDSQGIEADILINNAGIFSFLGVLETTDRKLSCFIDLHVRAVTTLSRDFGRMMTERGRGYILNMSSMSCWMPMPGLAMYSATKAYIRVFTRSLHYELRDKGVKVMAAVPGGIATDLFGLAPKLMRIALRVHAVQTPEKFTRNAIKRLLKGRKQYINGWLNRISIFIVGIMPTWVRMQVKRKMLDKNITRP